jgi:signal transduction histidine kinase/DNA-binding response OmpR family regulator
MSEWPGLVERPRLLVVDDRQENLLAMRAALGDDYEVVLADSGKAALRELLGAEFALILLDVVMPDLDGFEVAALIKQKKRTRDIPIVFLTADPDQTASRRGYELGAVDFLAKPIDPGALRSKVSALVKLYLERRNAERLERRASDRLHSLADAIPHIVFTARPDGTIETLNRQWTARTGLPVEQGLELGWVSSVHPDDAGGLLQKWLQATGDAVECEVRLCVRDGTWRTQLVQIVRDESDDGSGWVGTFTDVEAQRQAEGALREREEQLAEARRLEAVGRIAGGVAHDFNNLLTAVLGYAMVALKKLDREHPAWAKVDAIRETAERATSITRQLLAFSRRQVLRPEILDLNDVVTGMERTLRPMMEDSVELVLRVSEHPLPVRADRAQLEQVLLNLVLNARDAMPTGGRLCVATSPVDQEGRSCALLEVEDAGVGMDAETQALIFEPFFTTKAAGRGTGLGLSTVHGIVTQSGGTIRVRSAPGEGTTVRIFLPRSEEAPEERPGGPSAAAAPSDRPPTILLVDDDEQIRDVAREALTGEGYVVREARDGLEALQVASAHDVDLLVTDLRMPRMGGEELGRRFGHEHPGVPIVYISGATSEEGASGGGPRFLAKPFGPEALLGIVAEAVGRPPAGEPD